MYKRAWVVVLVSLLFVTRGIAQTTATISGSVRDGTGALIPGASVMAKNVETGITRTTMSDEQGRYQLLNLNVGRYEIEVSLSGFQTAVRSGIVLAVGDQTVVNFTLQVGQVAEKVEVTAQAPLVATTTSSVGGIIETSQIVNLPLNGRSFDELAQLQPGVTVAKFAGVGTMQSGYTTKISIRGARPEQNSFLLDGTDVMGPTNQIPGSVAGQSFGVDAVREFRVETSTYSAQYGRAAGGVINVVTKSGTNELHGSAFEFLRNDNLDASKRIQSAAEFDAWAPRSCIRRLFDSRRYRSRWQRQSTARLVMEPRRNIERRGRERNRSRRRDPIGVLMKQLFSCVKDLEIPGPCVF